VRITADTNVLVRAAVSDHPEQSQLAATVLREAETVAVTLPTLCEFAWVLSRGYKKTLGEIASAIRRLIDSATVAVDRPAADAGLAVFERGGDFADGVIAFEGRRLGGEVFVSFDRRAIALVEAAGGKARLLGAPERAMRGPADGDTERG
jgi:predicted nucleic-acid-binding protein